MCGFAGLLRHDGLAGNDVAHVRAAADVLAHRGPDSAGLWNDSRIALGFRRLKIIDLSAAGEQPMSSADGSLHLVFNGEIYNYRELRDQLCAQGCAFKSQSDTEVLLHLYQRDGMEMLGRLRGMFAFAIWDAPRQKLFLARDPLGVKPLYFAERDGFIAFASELKALFAFEIKPEIDPAAIGEALTYRYVPAPRTGFKDIEKLPPGHFAVVENRALHYQRWWKLPQPDSAADADVAEHLRAAVSRRLISDVPLGAWLSGGIDSALVLAAMGSGVKTFSAGFSQREYDERDLARLSATHLKSAHSEFEVPADVFRRLPQIVWHADEPFFDSSCLPVFILAQMTKPHATVVLGGDGGDETFAGYDRYAGMALLQKYKSVPSLLRRGALAYAQWRHPGASRRGWDRMLRWLEKCRLMEASGRHPYLAAMELFSAEQKQDLFDERMLDETEGCDAREYLEGALLRAKESAGATDSLSIDVLQRADLETYLSGDVLHKVDRMSMAHGLEVRSPFLDVDLVAWALSVPEKVRFSSRTTKPLLRAAAAQVLPESVVAAPKRGFGVPLDDWFRGPLQKMSLEIFAESSLVAANLLKPRYWESLWKEHQAGQAQHGERLYALLALEVWHRMFFASSPPLIRPAIL